MTRASRVAPLKNPRARARAKHIVLYSDSLERIHASKGKGIYYDR